MNKTHRSNLAKTAIYLLEKVKAAKFDMERYAFVNGYKIDPNQVTVNYNECGTTCCFAGHAPMALNISPKSKIGKIADWFEYLGEVFLISPRSIEWKFLFSQHWSNSRKQAAARAVMLLESDFQYHFSYNDMFLTRVTYKQLIERLNVFVIADK